jgi:hypothetical protein
MAARQDEKLQHINANVTILAKINEELKSKIPPTVLLDLKPSEACSTSRVNYQVLLDSLGLPFPPAYEDTVYCALPEDAKHNILFDWAGKIEKDSYPVVEAHLRQNGFPHAYVVADGKKIMGSNRELFDVQVFSLRSKLGVKGEAVTLQARVHGRIDLVVCEQSAEQHYIMRHMVDVGIEIKPGKTKKTDAQVVPKEITFAHEMECVMQVIGLCTANCFKAPPVMLTDLVSLHVVFYLTKTEDDHLRFSIQKQYCKSFSSALQFASDLSKDAKRRGIARDFGRGPTPPPTIYNSVDAQGSQDSQDLAGESPIWCNCCAISTNLHTCYITMVIQLTYMLTRLTSSS